mgnify:CR=1 FL=1
MSLVTVRCETAFASVSGPTESCVWFCAFIALIYWSSVTGQGPAYCERSSASRAFSEPLTEIMYCQAPSPRPPLPLTSTNFSRLRNSSTRSTTPA